MVRAGLGVASLPRWAAAPQLASGAVVGLPLTAQGFRRTWSAAQLRDQRAPAYLKEFIRLLAERPLYEEFPLRRKTARRAPVRRAPVEDLVVNIM
jgi:DNA-binding transcriptional LysR family regulator